MQADGAGCMRMGVGGGALIHKLAEVVAVEARVRAFLKGAKSDVEHPVVDTCGRSFPVVAKLLFRPFLMMGRNRILFAHSS